MLNHGSKPSEAIAFIGKELSLLDSGSIYMLAFHRALCEFIGPAKFDRIFSEGPFYLSNKPNIRLTAHLFEYLSIESLDELKQGDQCCFQNLLAYSVKHEVNEEFIAIVSNEKFKTFLGIGLPPEGSTQEEVEQMMLDSFNQAPLQEGKNIFAKHTISWEVFQDTQTNPPLKRKGRLCFRAVRPNSEIITKLAEATLENVLELFHEMCLEPLSKMRKIE